MAYLALAMLFTIILIAIALISMRFKDRLLSNCAGVKQNRIPSRYLTILCIFCIAISLVSHAVFLYSRYSMQQEIAAQIKSGNIAYKSDKTTGELAYIETLADVFNRHGIMAEDADNGFVMYLANDYCRHYFDDTWYIAGWISSFVVSISTAFLWANKAGKRYSNNLLSSIIATSVGTIVFSIFIWILTISWSIHQRNKMEFNFRYLNNNIYTSASDISDRIQKNSKGDFEGNLAFGAIVFLAGLAMYFRFNKFQNRITQTG